MQIDIKNDRGELLHTINDIDLYAMNSYYPNTKFDFTSKVGTQIIFKGGPISIDITTLEQDSLLLKVFEKEFQIKHGDMNAKEKKKALDKIFKKCQNKLICLLNIEKLLKTIFGIYYNASNN